jgi:hypothetical protein
MDLGFRPLAGPAMTGHRFSQPAKEKISAFGLLWRACRVIPKSGNRFSDKITRKQLRGRHFARR